MSSILTLLTALNSLGQPIYAAQHTSGYNHGCSDAQISDPSERYINQPEKGPSFHSDAFMQAYHDGFNACSSGSDSSNSNNNNNDNSNNNDNQPRSGRSIAGNYADGYETGKGQGKSDFNSGRQHDNSCPRDFWNNVSYCTGYKIGYEAGWGASKIL